MEDAGATCTNTQQAQTIAATIQPTAQGETPTVTTMETCGGDDVSYRVPVTTSITYDGVQYDRIYATTNSVITFGQPDGTYWTYPSTPSISIASIDWVVYPNQRNDEHLIINSSDGGFQVDLSARPIWNQQTSVQPTNIVVTAAINSDGTVAISYALSGPDWAQYNPRTGARLNDGTVVPLEQANIQRVVEAPVLTPEPVVEPSPSPSPTVTPTPTPEPSPSSTPSPTPEPTSSPTPSPTSSPEPSPTPTPSPTPETPSPTPAPVEPSPSPSTEPSPAPVEPSPTPTPIPSAPEPLPSPQPTPNPEPAPQPAPPSESTSGNPIPPAVEPTPPPAPTPQPEQSTPEPTPEPSSPPIPDTAPTPDETPIPAPEPEPAPSEPEPIPAPEPQPEPQPEPVEQPEVAPEPAPEPVEPSPPVEEQSPAPEPPAPEPESEPTPDPETGLIPNSPDSLPETEPKLPEPEALKPHIQEDKAGVENGGIEFYGTKSQPQVIGEDGQLTPPPPPPGSGLPIPPDAITTTETFIGQAGGVTFNSPDIAVPVEMTYVCKTFLDEEGKEIHLDVDGNEHPIEQCTFLPEALDAIPGADVAIQAMGAAYTALANIGNDMSPLTRKKAKKILVATLVAGQISQLRRRF